MTLIPLYQFMLLIVLTLNIDLTPLTTQPIVNFDYLASTHISKQASSIYTIQSDPLSNASSIKKYLVQNGTLVFSISQYLGKTISKKWGVFQLNNEIVAFSYQINSQIIILDKSSLTITKKINNKWNFLKLIQSKKYDVIFLSTNNGNIYFCYKNCSFNNFILLEGSKHIGNTYLTLSPDESQLCSTDQFTGYISIWSVPTLLKLYEYSTQQNGIRAQDWHVNSQIIYFFGYLSGNFYQFSTKNGLTLMQNVSSNLTYMTSCFYLYETSSLLVFSYSLSSVITFSTQDYTYQILLDFIGAQIMFVDSSYSYFTVFNNISASFYKINTLCSKSFYFDINSNTCQPCGFSCLSCRSYICLICIQGYKLSSDSFKCLSILNNSNSQNKSVKHLPTSIINSSSTFFINKTFSFINTTFTIPAHRQFLNIFFQFFSSFDHLILYIYHNRTYGPNMKFYLQLIHDTIDYRFNFINNQVCKSYLGIDFNQWKHTIDFKANYSWPLFVNIQNNGQGLFVNNLQYFFLNIPVIVITLLIAKSLFYLLYNYKISILLRKFEFTGIIILSLIQGNVQLFFFSFTADFINLFCNNFRSKLINISTIIFGWIFICLSTVGIFCLYIIYKKRSKFLLQNCKGTLNSTFYILLVNGLMNIIRGIIHRILITFPLGQVLALMIIELLEMSIHYCSLKKYKFIQSSFILILFMISNFSRVIFNFTLLFQSQNTIHILDLIHTLLIFTIIIIIFLGIFYQINQLSKQIKKMFLIQVQKCKLKKQIIDQQHIESQLVNKKSKTTSVETLKDKKWPHFQKIKSKHIRKNVRFSQQGQSTAQKADSNATKQLRKEEQNNLTVRVKKARNEINKNKNLNIIFTKK